MRKDRQVFVNNERARTSDCGDKTDPNFVPTREEVEQSRKLVEEVRRSTRDAEPLRKGETKAARPFS